MLHETSPSDSPYIDTDDFSSLAVNIPAKRQINLKSSLSVMTIHFTEQEFGQRQGAVRRSLVAEGLDGLLIFRQESMYYLTGYDTSGYTMFQGMYLDADGKLFLLTRSADRIQSRLTSVIGDIRIWEDGDGVNPDRIDHESRRNQHRYLDRF